MKPQGYAGRFGDPDNKHPHEPAYIYTKLEPRPGEPTQTNRDCSGSLGPIKGYLSIYLRGLLRTNRACSAKLGCPGSRGDLRSNQLLPSASFHEFLGQFLGNPRFPVKGVL